MNPRYICSKARIISLAHHAEHLASASSSLPPSCVCVCIYLRRTRAGRAIKGTVNDDAEREREEEGRASLALALSPAVSVGRRAAAVILNANNLQSAHTTLSSVLVLLERASEANRRWEMLQSTVSRSSYPSVRWEDRRVAFYRVSASSRPNFVRL